MNYLGFILIFSGFTLLALAMDRHHKQVRSGPAAKHIAKAWRISGGILLLVSLIPEVLRYGLSIGLAVWFGMATFSVIAIGLLLAYRPNVLQWLFVAKQ